MAFNTLQDIKDVPKDDWKMGNNSQRWYDLADFVCNRKNKLVDRAAALRYTHQISLEFGEVGVAGGDCESDRSAVYQYMNDN